MITKNNFLLLFVILSSLSFGESSGYASDADGLTEQEKNKNEISLLKQELREVRERVDGMTTLMEGLSAGLNELREQKSKEEKSVEKVKTDEINDEDTLRVIKEIVQPVSNYDKNISQKKVELDKNISTPSLPAEVSVSTLYSEGVRLFVKHQYDESKKRFIETEEKQYKPAASNYYLGEIAYANKDYGDALSYFKKSIGLYDQASYNDVLLLHTAISLEKTGEREQAKRFYQTIIENYSEKKSAAIARDNLDKLK